MEAILVGFAIVLNVAFIKFKFDKGRLADAFVDASLLTAVMAVFSGTLGALVAGTIGSALISILLWFSPPKLPKAFA